MWKQALAMVLLLSSPVNKDAGPPPPHTIPLARDHINTGMTLLYTQKFLQISSFIPWSRTDEGWTYYQRLRNARTYNSWGCWFTVSGMHSSTGFDVFLLSSDTQVWMSVIARVEIPRRTYCKMWMVRVKLQGSPPAMLPTSSAYEL